MPKGMRTGTDDLIATLTDGITPVPRHAIAWSLVAGLAAGGAAALVLVVAGLGIRPDLPRAVAGFSFWMKGAYALSIGLGAIVVMLRVARPDARRADWLAPLLLPGGLLAMMASGELARTPRAGWPALWLGSSWRSCPMLVLALAVPIYLGLVWSFRGFAPTRLRAAGAVAGLAAGACGATVYALHCPEVSAVFVLTWYTLGILLATLGGALAGPHLLRW
jgi:hypothetical protein